MITTEIYIENQKLDLYKDISSEFTYNIDDVKDFSARNTNFSKTIVLPGNATNNQLFGNIFEFGSANFYDASTDNVGYNFNASKSASCVILVDKIQVFKGVIRLLEIVVDRGSIEYECVVFGELGGLVSSISNKKIEDLDFSAYDELWTKDNITASWDWASGATGKGYGIYYPLIDYGGVSYNSKNDWLYTAFRPAFYVKEIVKKIIEDAGYTYESEFFNTALFSRLVIPNNQKELSSYSDVSFWANFVPVSTVYNGSPSARPLLAIYQVLNAGFFTASNGNTRFTYTGTASLSIKFALSLSGYSYYRPTIIVRKNGSSGVASISYDEGYVDISQETDYFTLVTNDYIEFVLDWEGWDIGDNNTFEIYSSDIKFRTSLTQLVPLNYGEKIIMNSITPRGIFQKDFLASIIKMFNLYVVESTDREKHLHIEPYIDFYTTTASLLKVDDTDLFLIDDSNFLFLDDASANYLDWTYKVNRAKPLRLKPMSELNGRFYEFKYKQDNDYYNEQYFKKYSQGYGDRLEDTGFEFANDKQTAEVIFSSTALVGYNGQEKVYPTIFKLSNTNNTQSEDKIDHNIRIMQVHKVTGVSNWHIRNTSGNIDGHLTSYGYAGHLNDPDEPTSDINFGAPKEIFFELATDYPTANLFNGYWSDYVAEITDKDSKLLTCELLLKDIDIYSLDFSKLIYIDGSLWRLNKVIDYNPMSIDTTKCEFLKVIELTYA